MRRKDFSYFRDTKVEVLCEWKEPVYRGRKMADILRDERLREGHSRLL
jgi:hypothetical protein